MKEKELNHLEKFMKKQGYVQGVIYLDNRWIKDAWKQEARKRCNSIKDKIILTMQTKYKRIQSEGEDVKLKGKILDREFKPIWKQVKKCFKKGSLENRLEQYIKCKGNAK